MPAGRPSGFNDLDLKRVKILVERGFTNDEMADFFDVSRSTWYSWQAKYPEFLDALKDWKDGADRRIERSLFERAAGYQVKEDKVFNNNGEALVVPTVKHYPPDPTSCIFWLKNRQPEKWRDKQEHDISTSVSLVDLTGDNED